MEKLNNFQTENTRDLEQDKANSLDVSSLGGEQQAVYNQDQDNSENKNSDGGSEQNENQKNHGRVEEESKEGKKENGYRQGLADNDNRNPDVPEIGREDAERTSRETPRM